MAAVLTAAGPVLGQEKAPTSVPRIDHAALTLDGQADDWSKLKPALKEVGGKGRGQFENIDIKRAWLAHDGKRLLVFLETKPSFKADHAEDASTHGFCEIYFDTDNNPETGCEGVTGFGYGKINGYEVRAFMPMGSSGDAPFATYTLMETNKEGEFGFDSAIEGGEAHSTDEDAPIAHGKQGVEFAIPLKHLNVQPGDTVRVLLKEAAHSFDKKGYNELSITLSETKAE
jgi:hypothetical protein